MIILISPEKNQADETTFVNALFERGLSLFHIRKYRLTDSEMTAYVEAIDNHYRKRLVLHSHFHLAAGLGIERLHCREEDRKQHRQQPFMEGFKLSTSVHSIADFNSLPPIWDYTFLSPVFPSISKKGYGTNRTVLNDFRLRNNPHVQLVALGGIDESNYRQAIDAGADAIALLGAIWESPEPVAVFDNINRKLIIEE